MFTQEEIDSLSNEDFTKLEEMVNLSSLRRREQVVEDVMNRMRAIADESGVAIEDVIAKFDVGRVSANLKNKSRKVKPKFRHPKDPTLTWAGRGQQPKWLVAYIESGGKIDDCKI